jgi:hypothetical protein
VKDKKGDTPQFGASPFSFLFYPWPLTLDPFLFASDKPEDQRQDDADEDARGQREVEGVLLAPDG